MVFVLVRLIGMLTHIRIVLITVLLTLKVLCERRTPRSFSRTSPIHGFQRISGIWLVGTKKLKDIMIGDTKIIINREKFIKVCGKGVLVAPGPMKRHAPCFTGRKSFQKRGHSYKDVMVGKSFKVAAFTCHCPPPIPSQVIELEKDNPLKARLGNCWIGKDKNFLGGSKCMGYYQREWVRIM
ncbi:hypothetical protein Tco_0722702 [Tanacetum coccineum]